MTRPGRDQGNPLFLTPTSPHDPRTDPVLPPETSPEAVPPPPPEGETRPADPGGSPYLPTKSDPADGAGSSDRSGSRPRSTNRPVPAKLAQLADKAVRVAGAAAHRLLTRADTPERYHGVWLADDDDIRDIGGPAASLAARRLPAGANNPDAWDIAQLGLALLDYLHKNLADLADLRPPEPAHDTVPGEAFDGSADQPAPATPQDEPLSPGRFALGRRAGFLSGSPDPSTGDH